MAAYVCWLLTTCRAKPRYGKDTDDGLMLTAAEVDVVRSLILHVRRSVVDTRATTSAAINDFVDEWELVMGALPADGARG